MKVRVPKLLGYWVIIEKYIPITIADMTLIFGEQFFYSITARFLLRLVPRDAYGIFLDVDYESLLKRRGEKVESRKYLDLQDTICRWYATHNNCLIVDTSKTDIERTHELIMDYLNI